ncbi:MAG: pyrroloquinoline quinone biosynthesis protein PqqE [Gammaproteobacteria bacterium]|nr:MAG: pyrroloquinoline quinone biosynthesis protein PqqE [Gammaproteobacteria bacterium]
MPKAGSGVSLDGLGMPMWLTLELTYRCPLHCPWCSNPLDFDKYGNELSTEEWKKVLRDGRKMGSLQLGFTGGEPMLRDDIEELVGEAENLGYYTNLITSGIGLAPDRLKAMKKAGLKQIQLSLQSSDRDITNKLVGVDVYDQKLAVAHDIKAQGFPMVLNVPVCKQNISQTRDILKLAEELGVEYIEFANIQYYNWALVNRSELLPTREELEDAEEVVMEFRERLGNRMSIYFVIPDYFDKRPKACMNGWGAIHLTIAPDGAALPCQESRVIKNLEFPNVREHSLEWIWHESPVFNEFRGDKWMKEPCRSCDERDKDFGGCRCQAYLLTGDAANTDPVCAKSSMHDLIQTGVAEATDPRRIQRPLVLRRKGAITSDFLETAG